MYSLRGRLVYAALDVLVAAYLISTGHPWGWLLLAVPLLLAWGFFRYGPMVVAFRAYHDRNWSELTTHLQTVRRPQWLTPQNRAYFTFLSGVAAFNAGDTDRARRYLEDVPVEHLRTDNMRAMLAAHLAEVALATGDRRAAQTHLEHARAIPHKADVDAILAALQQQMAAV